MRAIWTTVVLPGVLLAGSAKPVDFDREVRPILSDKCFKCHGPDGETRKAGLRFDDKASAFAKGVIAPGHSEQSKLYQRISSDKKALKMPPVYSGMKLTDAEIGVIQRWIDEGAKWETHWAYQAPKRPALPVTKRKNWARNPIDSFLLARLESEGLTPSPAAPKTTLIRRVTFDLTGLPPTPAEVAAFVKDKSPDAYERVVDRLLASPQYGERMAMQWLDLARYADTHGYHIDSHRDMWPWRDWVISAFNRNLPFDQFTIWQLAGDLLPNATREQKVATGFNRNHMINFEGGAIPEEYQAEYVADRVEATSNVWMGTTLGCAKCHDHKYDPIRQKDFYRFGAFFNTIPEKGLDGQTGNAEPVLALPSESQETRLAELEKRLRARMAELPPDDLMLGQWMWEKASFERANPVSPTDGLRAWYELDGNLTDISGHFRNGRVLKGDINFAAGGPVNRAADVDTSTEIRWPAGVLEPGKPFTLAFWFRIGRQKESKMFQQRDSTRGFEVGFGVPETLPRLRRGHHLEARWFDGSREYQVRSAEWIEQGRTYHAALVSDGRQVSLFLDGKPSKVIVEKQTLPGPVEVAAPIELNNTAAGGFFRGRLDDLRVYDRPLREAEAEELAVEYPAQVLLATPGKKSRELYGRLREYYLTKAGPAQWRQAYAEFKSLSEQREELEAKIPTVMVMQESEKPRDTYLLGRGDYTNKVEKVTPGVPAMLPPLAPGEKANRLALARWLVNPNHPLTARVAINRYWQMYFGTGIVKTAEDFGSQGEPPVHPELLDWLATEFVRTGWDVKAMQRLIVTSAAYRQSSKVTPALHEKDPENRLLARGPRFRLPAEMIRDNALAVSGLLKEHVGGPSVLPYQPAGLWEELAFGEAFSAQEYKQDHGDNLYRRSMYTFWKRTVPPASLNTFDAPDREKCTARRAVTNTPLQALVTLNDPTYIEAARNLAQELLDKRESNDQRLRDAFEQVTARPPSKEELRVLRSSLQGELSTYAANKASAEDVLKIGESAVDRKVEPVTLAAWTNLCTVLLNLDETITKE